MRSRWPAGARSEGGRGGSEGGRQRPALGPGLREPETAAAAAAAAGGAEGTPPLPAPCLRLSLLPRGLAQSRLREGERWLGAAPGGGLHASPLRPPLPTRGPERAGSGVPPAPLPSRAAPPSASATLGARLDALGCGVAALVPREYPVLHGGLGVRGRGGGGRGLGRDAAPPAAAAAATETAAAALWGVLPCGEGAQSPPHRSRPAGAGAEAGGCSLIPQVLAFGGGMVEGQGLFGELKGGNAGLCVLGSLVLVFPRLILFFFFLSQKKGMEIADPGS